MAEIKNSIQEGIKEEMEKRKSYVGARIKQGKVTELDTLYLQKEGTYSQKLLQGKGLKN